MSERNAKGVSSAVRRRASGAAGKTLKRTGSAAHGATSAVSGATGMGAVEGAGKQVQKAAAGAGGAVQRAGGAGDQRTLGEEIRTIVREAALEVLVPVARRATRQAAMYAVTRGPQLARDTIAPKVAAAIEEAGGPGSFAKGALSSVTGARTGMLGKLVPDESESRPWRDRPLPVEESIDVVVPLETAYDRFTDFEEYAKVMSHGETVDERPNERIVWARSNGVEDTAVITFHRLSDRLTRVMVTYEHQPHGVVEKTTSLLHRLRHGLSADLMRFKAFAEISEQDTEMQAEPEPEAAPEEG
jgi:hypothetical protein